MPPPVKNSNKVSVDLSETSSGTWLNVTVGANSLTRINLDDIGFLGVGQNISDPDGATDLGGGMTTGIGSTKAPGPTSFNALTHLGSDGNARILSLLKAETTDASATPFWTDGRSGSVGISLNFVSFPVGTTIVTYAYKGLVIAQRTDAGGNESAVFEFEGAIRNDNGTTALVGTPTVNQIAADAAAAGWTVNISANDTIDELIIEGVGEVGKTIEWSCTLETVCNVF